MEEMCSQADGAESNVRWRQDRSSAVLTTERLGVLLGSFKV